MKFLFGNMFFIFCKLFFKLYCPLSVTGRENLPSSSFILCSNHGSHMDTPVLMLTTGMHFNRFGMVAARDYFFDHIRRKLTATLFMNLIPINRKCTRSSIDNNLDLCKQFVQDKQGNLIIYPEGTRSLTGEMQTFKRGAALIATELNLPIVPAYIQGTHTALPKGRGFPKPTKIKVAIGQPIYPSPDQNKRTMIQTLENEIKRLKDNI